MSNLSATPAPPLLSTRHKRAIAASLLLAAVLYLIIVISTGFTTVLAAMARLNTLVWCTLLACSLANYLLRYLRWQYYLRLFGHTLPHGLHFIYYLAGFALTTTPGKSGEMIRSVLLRPHGIPYPHSIAAFFTERLLDVILVASLSLLAMLVVDRFTLFVITITLVVLAVLPLLRHPYTHVLLRRWQQRLRPSRRQRMLGHLRNLLRKARRLLAARPLYSGLLLGFAAWSMQGIAFTVLLSQMGVTLPFALGFGIYATSLLAGAVSFLPGGVGTTEAAMIVLLTLMGADTPTAVAISVISRLITLWFAVSLGLLATAYLSLRGSPPNTTIQLRGTD